MSMPQDYATKDYYSILGVKADATADEINRAFKGVASQWHPDKAPAHQEELFRAKFQEAEEAKRILSDEGTRAEYNLGRREYLKTASAPHMAAPRTSVVVAEDAAHSVNKVPASPTAGFNELGEAGGAARAGGRSWLPALPTKIKLGIAAVAFAFLANEGYSLWKKHQPPSNFDLSASASMFVARLGDDMRDLSRSQQIQQKLKVSPADAALILGTFSGATETGRAKGWTNRKLIGQYMDKGVSAHVLQKLSDGSTVDITVDRDKVAIDFVDKKPEGAQPVSFDHSDRTKAALAKDTAAADLADWKKRNAAADASRPKPIRPAP